MRCEKAIDYEKTKLIMNEEFKLLLYEKKKKRMKSLSYHLCNFFCAFQLDLRQ